DTVRQTPWPSPLGEISMMVSIGVATTRENITLDELLAQADKALYQAKNTGRNRIALFSDYPGSIEGNA
ncbi:MAG TPA: diguanylate cyclase, partial [Thermotogota bacterium]|nr:diguanylate cyclase [Thermotogota bacterium]